MVGEPRLVVEASVSCEVVEHCAEEGEGKDATGGDERHFLIKRRIGESEAIRIK